MNVSTSPVSLALTMAMEEFAPHNICPMPLQEVLCPSCGKAEVKSVDVCVVDGHKVHTTLIEKTTVCIPSQTWV